MPKIFVSTGAFASDDLGEILDLADSFGIRRLELSSGLRWSWKQCELARDAKRRGLELLVHNYFPPSEQPFVLNLAAINAELRERSLAHCLSALELCSELGVPFYSVHAGFALRDIAPNHLGKPLARQHVIPIEEANRILIDSLGQVCERASVLGLGVALENNVLAPFNLVDRENSILPCVTPVEILEVVNAVGSPCLGTMLDVGHAFVSARTLGVPPDSYFDLLTESLLGLQVSENDGTADQGLAVTTNSWFLPHLEHLSRELPIVLETDTLSADELYRAMDLLKSVGASEEA